MDTPRPLGETGRGEKRENTGGIDDIYIIRKRDFEIWFWGEMESLMKPTMQPVA